MVPVPGPPAVARDVFGDAFDLACVYADILVSAGVERGLIGPRETDRIWDRHLLNSAVVEEAVGPASTVVDVGSGAGLPGIPLALARPDIRVTLLEPMQRRCVFLHEAVARLGLEGRVTVVRGRAPNIGTTVEGHEFDVAVARALAPLGRLGAMLVPILGPGGVMLALRGSRVVEELSVARGELDAQGWCEVDVVKCGVGRLSEPATVLRAVCGTPEPGRRQGSRKTREARREREAQRARGHSRST
ncbi:MULTISPECIES: 16S rRNA (guanine(527)-N(7))-methyltransferase RsmG [unclassified Frankia]|uniref:16S rRNA (guanine(527)-N(7))-methyltransferase RsmG n=1 Tax=unclassified Frankia TaxID=2632575 RepID=UPI001EF4F38A|nr:MULTISPECIES: 16S rRNA (guanine(527)-N(7))-methyltransferase RsmG [unclassified Frankia]